MALAIILAGVSAVVRVFRNTMQRFLSRAELSRYWRSQCSQCVLCEGPAGHQPCPPTKMERYD